MSQQGLRIGVVILALVLSGSYSRAETDSPSAKTPPVVAGATPISPTQTQEITIVGSHLGRQAPYTGNSAYILFWDVTARWSAGLTSANVFDDIGLVVKSWTEDRIVIEGFTGDYGATSQFVLSPGDLILIYVTNPQNKVPADSWLYNFSINPLVSVCTAIVGSGNDCYGPQ